jgi:hypothetical protein
MLRRGVLGAFADIFRIDGSAQQTPREIAADAPIQPVADTSRIAQAGLTIYGSLATGHVGANIERDFQDLDTILGLGAPPLRPEQHDVWLIGLALLVDDSTSWLRAAVGIAGSSAPPLAETTQWIRPVAAWTVVQPIVAPLVAAGQGEVALGADGDPAGGLRSPVLMRPDNAGAGIYMVTEGFGPITSCRVLYTLRVVPRGATPPGMA